jgi:hypothetical protein
MNARHLSCPLSQRERKRDFRALIDEFLWYTNER